MQERCTECGLQWDDWLDRACDRIRMRTRDWLLLFVIFPVVAAIPPLLVGRGAIMGARTFEASYYLTIPAFAGMVVLYLVVIRLGFVFFVEPLRPVPQQVPTL